MGQATDRSYWMKRGSDSSVAVADALLELVNEVTQDGLALKYNKHYIGLARGGIADNFVQFRARKDYSFGSRRSRRTGRSGPRRASGSSVKLPKLLVRARASLTRDDA